MAFGFFKDKSKGPLEVTCPLCQHLQQESRLAVSSYCKSCGAYLTFDKSGEISARPVAPPDPFAHRPPQPKVEIDYKAREQPALPASKPLPAPTADSESPQEVGHTSETEEKEEADEDPESPPEEPTEAETPSSLQTALPETSSPHFTIPDSPSATPRYHGDIHPNDSSSQKKIVTRDVTCFECGDTHPANIHANSTQCRSCGRLISMEDREVKERYNSSIQTRGNVHIYKKGVVLGGSIQCHKLTVEGDFTGDVECSGDLILRRHGKITGKVVCNRLLVEKRAKIEFHSTVEMNECLIDGLVTGNLACRGLLALEKRATLTGNIKVGRLTVADGARHSGQIQMGGF